MSDNPPFSERCTCSQDWKDDVTFDISLFLNLPEPALLRVLHNLRYHDLLALKKIVPAVTELCDLEITKLEKEFPSRPFYIFNRCAPSEREEEMAGRQNVCMTYSSRDASVYLFGGEAIEYNVRVDARATFNDLWRLNLVTMKWSRVVIRTTPYPISKSHASLVTWNNKLVLYGGRSALPGGRGWQFESEIQIFDLDSRTWRCVPNFDGPCSAGHSAVISEDLMIVYGGWDSGLRDIDENRISVFDLKTETWHDFTLDISGNTEFPRMNGKRSKLVLVRDGLLLITGEMEDKDYGSSILVRYDAADPLKSKWDWKPVTTSGRWWDETWNQGQRHRYSEPNYKFHAIAEVRNATTIRLVSLGSLRNDRISRPYYNKNYEDVQAIYREFCRELGSNLEAEFRDRTSRSDYDLMETCFVFSFRNIQCHIQNCFLSGPEIRKTQKIPKELNVNHPFKVSVKFLNSQNSIKMDDFDEWEVRLSIRSTVNRLHGKYYYNGRYEDATVRVPMRNGMLKRLSVYTAEISVNADFENFGELIWKPQPQQYGAPVETGKYSLIGAHQEVVMHAGSIYDELERVRMGRSSLLVPTKVIQQPDASLIPSLDIHRRFHR